MSKSRVCAEKTIKAAQACTKKTNLLVYERQKGEGCSQKPKSYIPPISNPQVKRIRICTGAELKKMCPPPPCPCPPKKQQLGLFAKLIKVVGFGAKSLLALGAIYVTHDLGIWGDSDSTGRLYQTMCDIILPNIVDPVKEKSEKEYSSACRAELELFNMFEKDPYCCDKFPIDHESEVYQLQQKWNKIVTATFSTIAGFPGHVRNWSHQVYCKMFHSESCKALKAKDEEKKECCPCN